MKQAPTLEVMDEMKTIRIKGSPALNDWFAEQLVKEHGPDGARGKVCGPALDAVERVIAAQVANKPTSEGA